MAQVNESPNVEAEVGTSHFPTPAPTENPNPTPNRFMHTALYVGDIDRNVNDGQLYDLFNQIGQVVSVYICKEYFTHESRGYGYVNFTHAEDAAKAMDELNFTPLNNKPIRIMYSNRDPSARKSTANIFIKNLGKEIDNKALHDTFSSFGKILSCKVAMDGSGESKGYGFVQFEEEESAKNAIDKLNGMLINDKQVYVGRFQRKQDRERAKLNNLYVKNFSESTTDEDLRKTFGEYGTIISAVVMRKEDGTSKCFGFVSFESADASTKALVALNGKKFDGKEWYVRKAQKKSERELELKERYGQSTTGSASKYQGANLYLKNLDDSVSDEKLRELFSEFGIVTSCKVMRDPQGISRGCGFVEFSTPEEATRALGAMNGQMFAGKPLYVAVAQRKEERRAKLQAQFSQMRPVATAPSVAPRLPMHHPGAPPLGPQLLFGQARPPFIHQAAGFGYPRQLFPGMGPRGAPLPNFYLPIVQRGQLGQPPDMQQLTQPVPWMQMQQMFPRGIFYRYPRGQHLIDIRHPGVAGGFTFSNVMSSQPIGNAVGQPIPIQAVAGGFTFSNVMSSQPIGNAVGQPIPIQAVAGGFTFSNVMSSQPIGNAVGQPIPIQALATTLANASLEQQKIMLGEALYPLVDNLEHESATKVTGMILEMDHTEVLHLIESADDLKTKVAEAMNVLRDAAQEQSNIPADQLASLSLNDDS